MLLGTKGDGGVKKKKKNKQNCHLKLPGIYAPQMVSLTVFLCVIETQAKDSSPFDSLVFSCPHKIPCFSIQKCIHLASDFPLLLQYFCHGSNSSRNPSKCIHSQSPSSKTLLPQKFEAQKNSHKDLSNSFGASFQWSSSHSK